MLTLNRFAWQSEPKFLLPAMNYNFPDAVLLVPSLDASYQV